MPFESKLVSINVRNGDATVDFTEPGFGTPDAAIVYVVREMLDSGRIVDDNQRSITFWDGTRTRCVCVWDENGVGTTDSRTTASTSAVVLNGNFAGAFEYTISNITNGIRLTKVNNNLSDTAVSVLLIKGVANVRVDTFTPNAASGGDVSVTTPGFQPDYIQTISPGGAPFNSGISGTVNDALWAVAHIARDGAGFNLVSCSWGSDNGQSVSDVYIDVRDSTYIARNALASQQVLEFRSFDASGFTVRSGSNRAGNRDVAYLAIELEPGDAATTFSDEIPISTGNKTYTTTGLNPDTIIMLQNKVPVASLNALLSTSIAETDGFYAVDSGGDEFSGGGASEDQQATSSTIDYSDTSQFAIYEASTTSLRAAATHVSNGTEEFTMNWTTAGPTPRWNFSGVAIGTEVSAAAPADLMPFFTHMAAKGML